MGIKGERAALKKLKKMGYKFVKRNYTTPFGEADIICEKEGKTVFVEVKTRTSDLFGEPKEAVDFRKREKYRKIAAYYIATEGEKDISFAVAEVVNGEVNIIEDAFI
ncbi:MAG: YraN family protein [Clostridia bacterium]|nr:YraN family protein [Clostridia bacterium]